MDHLIFEGGGGEDGPFFPNEFDYLYKMLIFNLVIEQHMENFKNFKPEFENWAK